ncbi:protein enabled homolog [Macrobrachium rosenbergii]|uniref:protein enabled homolog n=1 Tax=Macrobrachium rosenbergii TaxID=79674 RepID=UPI0034D5F0E1
MSTEEHQYFVNIGKRTVFLARPSKVQRNRSLRRESMKKNKRQQEAVTEKKQEREEREGSKQPSSREEHVPHDSEVWQECRLVLDGMGLSQNPSRDHRVYACDTFEIVLNRPCWTISSSASITKNGPPNKPAVPSVKVWLCAEADCRYKDGNQKGNNSQQPTSNRQSSSLPNSTPASQHTVTAGRSTDHRGPCQDCRASGNSSAGYPACPKHVVTPRHLSAAVERTSPWRGPWTVRLSGFSGWFQPPSAPANFCRQWIRHCSIDRPRCPPVSCRGAHQVDRDLWTNSPRPAPTAGSSGDYPLSEQVHRLGVVCLLGTEWSSVCRDIPLGCPTPTPTLLPDCFRASTSSTTPDLGTALVTAVPLSADTNPPHSPARPSPWVLRPDGQPRITPSFKRERTNYRCRPCNVRGHSERWAKCPRPKGSRSPGPPSALSDTPLPVALAITGQCLAPSILAGCSLPSALPKPGPESVPVPGPDPDLDPPPGDPPNLTTVIIAQCEPPTPDGSSSHTLPPTEDNPLAGLDITSFLVDQELSGQDADEWPSQTLEVPEEEEEGAEEIYLVSQSHKPLAIAFAKHSANDQKPILAPAQRVAQ